MDDVCRAVTTIRQMRAGWWAPVAFIGGSLTVGTGCSNTAEHSWRRLFIRYLYERYERRYHCRIGEVMMGIGAMSSFGMSFIAPRYLPNKKPAMAFIVRAVNDGDSRPGGRLSERVLKD